MTIALCVCLSRKPLELGDVCSPKSCYCAVAFTASIQCVTRIADATLFSSTHDALLQCGARQNDLDQLNGYPCIVRLRDATVVASVPKRAADCGTKAKQKDPKQPAMTNLDLKPLAIAYVPAGRHVLTDQDYLYDAQTGLVFRDRTLTDTYSCVSDAIAAYKQGHKTPNAWLNKRVEGLIPVVANLKTNWICVSIKNYIDNAPIQLPPAKPKVLVLDDQLLAVCELVKKQEPTGVSLATLGEHPIESDIGRTIRQSCETMLQSIVDKIYDTYGVEKEQT